MEKIGRYVIESEIGRGAMGVVYLAHDPRLRRRVAVKTYALPEGLSEEQLREFQVRFLREAQAAASLSHPGIVVIYDVDGDPDLGLPFIAMEYIHGRSLKELLAQGGRVSPRWAFKMGAVLADALRVAHESGIIHRDIKPANILLRVPDGAPKIADFGVARLSTSDLTRTSASLGSPAYMSPEQFRGNGLDGRSDLFSLATVLYEAFSGGRPFTGEDIPSLAYAIAHEPVEPITRRIEDIPPGLDEFFERALAKNPEDRFSDGGAFLAALQEAASSQPSLAESGLYEAGEAREADPAELAESESRSSADSASGEMPVRRRRGRFLAMKLAAWAVLSLSLLGGATFWLLRPAHLKLDAKSSIETGRLSLLVDGQEVYTRQLSAPRQGNHVFGKLLGRDQETFQDWIKIPPGRHEVAARVLSEGAGPDFRDSIVVELKAGETRTLRMSAGRSFGAPVSLKLD
ncbi:MAG TPA: serine/threonine-protein kinase [Candidatus Polarisedimenticolia bacterium]|nr:serine/threonine-protein kinase [Candidatus Polarisedimenticolia bacterium]